jgi:hypothetical protein
VGQSLLLRAGILRTSPRPGRQEGCLKTGNPVCIEANGE